MAGSNDQASVTLVFEGGATHRFVTTRANAERVSNAVSRVLTSGTPGQVRFELAAEGAKPNYLLMDGSRVLAIQVETQ